MNITISRFPLRISALCVRNTTTVRACPGCVATFEISAADSPNAMLFNVSPSDIELQQLMGDSCNCPGGGVPHN